MPQPGKSAPRGEDWLVRKVQELEQKLQQLSAANPFGAMGIRPKKDGTEFDGFVHVNGPLDVNGDADFKGDMKVSGTLALPAGIIDNDALASPITVGRTSSAETNFAVTSTHQTLATTTITVPAGFTQALVFIVCNIGALNPNPDDDFLYSQSVIDGLASREVFGYVANNNGSVAVTTAKSDLLTGLDGGSISCAVNVRSLRGPWAASTANRAYVEAQAIFLR